MKKGCRGFLVGSLVVALLPTSSWPGSATALKLVPWVEPAPPPSVWPWLSRVLGPISSMLILKGAYDTGKHEINNNRAFERTFRKLKRNLMGRLSEYKTALDEGVIEENHPQFQKEQQFLKEWEDLCRAGFWTRFRNSVNCNGLESADGQELTTSEKVEHLLPHLRSGESDTYLLGVYWNELTHIQTVRETEQLNRKIQSVKNLFQGLTSKEHNERQGIGFALNPEDAPLQARWDYLNGRDFGTVKRAFDPRAVRNFAKSDHGSTPNTGHNSRDFQDAPDLSEELRAVDFFEELGEAVISRPTHPSATTILKALETRGTLENIGIPFPRSFYLALGQEIYNKEPTAEIRSLLNRPLFDPQPINNAMENSGFRRERAPIISIIRDLYAGLPREQIVTRLEVFDPSSLEPFYERIGRCIFAYASNGNEIAKTIIETALDQGAEEEAGTTEHGAELEIRRFGITALHVDRLVTLDGNSMETARVMAAEGLKGLGINIEEVRRRSDDALFSVSNPILH